jgi:hypothetical protein
VTDEAEIEVAAPRKLRIKQALANSERVTRSIDETLKHSMLVTERSVKPLKRARLIK